MHTSRRSWIVFVLLALFVVPAFAQDDGATKITASDIEKHLKIEEADAIAQARKDFTIDRARLASLNKAREDAIKASGLTQERYEEILTTIGTILEGLEQVTKGGEEAQSGKEALAAQNKESVAAVKAKEKELRDRESRYSAAREKVKAEVDAEKKGTPPDPAKLEGTWKFDVEATIDAMPIKIEGADRKKLSEDLLKSELGYTFGPGNTLVSSSKQPNGSVRSDKATYRLEGNKLLYKAEGRNKERDLDVGMKGDHLVVTMMGIGMHFKKQ